MVGHTHTHTHTHQQTNLETSVYKSLLEQLLKDPPHTFHEVGIEGFVIIFEINPSAKPTDYPLPLGGVSHDNLATLSVIIGNAKLKYIVSRFNSKEFIYLKLDGKPW